MQGRPGGPPWQSRHLGNDLQLAARGAPLRRVGALRRQYNGGNSNRAGPGAQRSAGRCSRPYRRPLPRTLRCQSLYVMRRHGALKHIYGESPVALESAAAYFATQLRHAEQALQDGRLFLVGHRLTTADMLLTTCLDWAVSYRVPITPACRSYLERITSRPGYRGGLAANAPRTA